MLPGLTFIKLTVFFSTLTLCLFVVIVICHLKVCAASLAARSGSTGSQQVTTVDASQAAGLDLNTHLLKKRLVSKPHTAGFQKKNKSGEDGGGGGDGNILHDLLMLSRCNKDSAPATTTAKGGGSSGGGGGVAFVDEDGNAALKRKVNKKGLHPWQGEALIQRLDQSNEGLVSYEEFEM